MPKYIDIEKLDLAPNADGVMNGVMFVSRGRSSGKTVDMVQAALKHMIERAEVIDVVKVVRCKNCMWRNEQCNCTNPRCVKSFYGCPVEDMHFCSYGDERYI